MGAVTGLAAVPDSGGHDPVVDPAEGIAGDAPPRMGAAAGPATVAD